MVDEKRMALAQETFGTLCRTLDENQWRYKKNEEKLRVECGARGEDLSMDLDLHVDAERQLVLLLSMLPLEFSEEKRIEGVLAVTAINRRLVNGCFDYDLERGKVFYRMSSSFMGSKLGKEAIEYILYASCRIIDEYNDKLLMLAKGMISLEQFISSVND